MKKLVFIFISFILTAPCAGDIIVVDANGTETEPHRGFISAVEKTARIVDRGEKLVGHSMDVFMELQFVKV